MSTFKLAIGSHNHQPVGNFQAILDQAHTRAYRPFLDVFRRHEGLRLSLHQSGIVWQWQKKAHPEFYRIVGELVDSGRLELLTGGFYEPIPVAIPERDIVGQISMLTGFLEDHFETRPDGLWLAERVWEPYLARPFAESGIRYVPVDDTHFLYAGFEPTQLMGPFITEHEGRPLRLLPISKKLRYMIPYSKPEAIIDYLKALAERNADGLAVYADDGEKLGIWTDSHEHCYTNGWLERFFTALEKESDWLRVVTLGEAADMDPVGRAYLPSASYKEMLHWALPPTAYLELENFENQLRDRDLDERFGRFVRGGHWRNFLAKYEEANLMHKRMLDVSHKLARFEAENPEKLALADTARDRLYAGQCNCPYWHGVFGGVYLPHIRQAVNAALIDADSTLDVLMNRTGLQITTRDFTMDGFDDVLVETDAFSALFSPRYGAKLMDLSLRRHAFSVTDTLTRRREGYHLKLDRAVIGHGRRRTETVHDKVRAREPGLADLLTDDWYLKRCFIDHFLTDDVDFDRFATNRFGEEGDFILEPFEAEVDESAGIVTFTRDGHVWRGDGVIPVRLRKTFTFTPSGNEITVAHELVSTSGEEVTVNFAIENNFNFQAGHAEDRYVLVDGHRPDESYLDSVAAHNGVRTCALVDEFRGIGLALVGESMCDELWRLPIFTVSQSDGGFERVFQGTTILTRHRVVLSDKPTIIRQSFYAGESQHVTELVRTAQGSVRP